MSGALRVLAIAGCAVLACGDSISNNHPPANPKPPPGQVWSYDYYSYVDYGKKKWSYDSYSYVYYSTKKEEYTCSGEAQTCGGGEGCYQDECCQMDTKNSTRNAYCMKSGGTNCSPQHSYNKKNGCPKNEMRQLVKGERLVKGGMGLISPNGRVSLTMQADGDLVMREETQAGQTKASWTSKTKGNPGAFLSFQNDGHLLLKSKSNYPLKPTNTKAWWTSGTNKKGAEVFMVQDDCDMVLFDLAGNVKWHMGTYCKFSSLGEILV